MIITSYSLFINEKNETKEEKIYEYGCAMLYFNVKNWEEITSFIEKEDIGEDGLEDEPHLTLLFGLHKDEVSIDDVKKAFEGYTSIDIELESVDLFENDKFDVVKFKVKKTKELLDINEKLSILPHTTDFPDYNPHITIAYVKKGKGKKYVVDNYNATLSSKKVMYSADEKTMFKLEE